MEKIAMFEKKELPVQSIENVRVERSMNATRQMKMKAPLVEIFSEPEQKTVYPKGFAMTIFDEAGKTTADIVGDYAVQYEEKKIVEAKGNIVIIDYSTGDTSYLSSIVWNTADHRVYSNEPVRSVNGQRVTIGDGFESDDEFRSPLITNQRGTILFDEEEI